MLIRQTRPEELEELMALYASARIFMAEHGNPSQWNTSYPERSVIENDIRSGHSYVCEAKGCIAAAFFYSEGEESAYETLEEGRWLCDAPYGVVHRIASAGTVRGAAAFCLAWAFDQCGNVKIDTHRDNYVMQKLLKKCGFVYCGIIRLTDGTERMTYQKLAMY